MVAEPSGASAGPTLSEHACRGIVAARSMGLCEIRIDVPGVCRGVAESKHHRRKVSQGGLWLPSNIVDACGDGSTGCHGWLERNPASARRMGLWLYAGSTSHRTPARLFWRGYTGRYLLHDDGSVTWLSPQALAAMGL